MKKDGTKIFTIVVFIVVFAVLLFYVFVNNNSTQNKKTEETSEKDTLLTYNFEDDYPKTAREVVKMHCKYMKNAYNGVFTEDELFTVNQQIRKLFDEELLQYNTQDEQLAGMKKEIEQYKENKKKFLSYTLAEASQVEYNTEEGKDYAKLKVTISQKVDSLSVSAEQEYILRKDADGKWKILGWQAVTNSTTEGE